MQKDIHPKMYETKVECACGSKFTVRSTKEEIHCEVCSECHPFYTGEQKFVQAAGRIDRFNKRASLAKNNQK